MDRLGSLKPDQLSPRQKKAYDDFDQYTSSTYGDIFPYKLADGSFIGPFGIQIHTPELAEIFLKFANTLRGFPVPSPAREVAILVVGAHTKAVYEQGAHRLISKLPQRDIEEINRGICPESFSREQRTAFQTATELMKPGPLAQSAWDEAFSVFGREGTMGIVHLVGFYKYVSTILNGFDAKWPQAQDGDE